MRKRLAHPLVATLMVMTWAVPVRAQHRVTTPEEAFGHEIGADYVLVDYTELHDYWIRLAHESDRMLLDTIGTTSEGRPQIMAVISSPRNLARVDHYRDIAARLARAKGVDETEARRLSHEGKAVVWIDGGLHATEVLGAQQLAELVYEMNDRSDPETLRFLNDVILLVVPANPDGMQLVSDWYMREADPKARSTAGVPVLYSKYAGHDDNRDFYMSALAETTNMNRVLYRRWYPQIVYDHHQTGPAGTVMFAPPFRDPPNQFLDPLVVIGIDQVGSAMHQRFIAEGKGGTTMRSGAAYSTWWNGGLRTSPYFHNMIGLLTETIGNPTPQRIPFVPAQQLPRGDIPLPVQPGPWHFRQSIEYEMTADRAVLDYASRNKDHLLFDIWRMGENSIQAGSRDSWTVTPSEVDTAEAAVTRGTRADWRHWLRDPAKRDPRGFIIPSDQRHFLTATKFVNALLKNGVEVQRATASFEVAGKRYPAGSYVVKTDQAFRPQVLDMFEAQDYPNDFRYPGGPPIPPYDATGWTLAWQMGISFDRILDGFDGPFEPITADTVAPPPGKVVDGSEASGFVVDHVNDAFVALNRVLRAGGEAAWYTDTLAVDGKTFAPGALYLETDRASVETLAREKGLDFYGVRRRPPGPSMPLHAVKVGLVDVYGGSMPSGWDRMILEAFGFDFDVLYPPDLDAGDLSRYDVLVIPDGIIPSAGRRGRFGQTGTGLDTAAVPERYRRRMGRVTLDKTVPRILDFVRRGGTVVAIGSSTRLAYEAGLPLQDALTADGKPLPSTEFFVPGTLLEMEVDPVSPLADGLSAHTTVMFSRSPAFRVEPGAAGRGIERVGWYDSAHPLRSGWAWGQGHLEGAAAVVEADLGRGKLILCTPRITFRAQPHGTFPFLFNGIYYGAVGRSRTARR